MANLFGHSHAGSLRSVPASLEGANWSGQLATSSAAQSLFGEALLANLVLPGEISAVAVDPVQGYLAVGTQSGTIHLFGSAAVNVSWTLRPAGPVKFLLFKPGTSLLICADTRQNLSVYDLSRPDPAAQARSHSSARSAQASTSQQTHPDTPARIAAHVARNSITALHLSPSHAHLLIGLRDGTVDSYDLDALQPSPWRAPNWWYEEEELLRKSGVPDAPPRRHIPLIVDLATSPKDLNLLLLAYEGGAILAQLKERTVKASFQLRLLPGAPGAGGVGSDALWTERGSPVTCVAWRPDGLMFALGHEDGLISFWSPTDDSKPLMVRTLAELDLDKPTMEDLGPRPLREPIFKMAWAGFPGKSILDGISADKRRSDIPEAEMEAGTSILTILGGSIEGQDPPGVSLLHFPPYVAPATVATGSLWYSGTSTQTPEQALKLRQSLRASTITSRETKLLSNGVVEDFVLLPRSSPHYSMAWDPCAIVLLTATPSNLPPLPPPSAQRGLMAAIFPPLPPPGMHKSQSSSSNTAGMVPSLSQDTVNAGPHPAPVSDFVSPRELRLPFSLQTAGAGAIIGGQLVDLSPHNYRRLLGLDHDQALAADTSKDTLHPPLPLKGGLAAAQTNANEDPEVLARAPGHFRIFVTHHLDGTVRFADASQHLLLVPKPSASPMQKSGTMSRDPSTASEQPRGPTAHFLDRPFPEPLPHLTISVAATLMHPALPTTPRLGRLVGTPGQLRITSVQMAAEVLEVSIVLRGGLTTVYRFAQARFSQSEEIEQQVRQETERDRMQAEEAAFSINSGRDRRRSSQSTGAGVPSSGAAPLLNRDNLEIGAGLEDDMNKAMRELDMSQPRIGDNGQPQPGPAATLSGPPPGRPKRDPKRGSVMQRFSRLGGSSKEPLQESEPVQGGYTGGEAPPQQFVAQDQDFISLSDTNDWSTMGFKASTLMDANRGDITHVAHSDVGFLAYSCGAGLAIVDLRGPEILLRENMGDDFTVTAVASGPGKAKPGRSERKMIDSESKAAVTSLTWTVCRMPPSQGGNEAILAPRLIVGRANGLVTVWTLTHALGLWIPDRYGAAKVDELDVESSKKFVKSSLQVLDVAGNIAVATPSELQRSIWDAGRSASSSMLENDLPLLLGWCGSVLFLRVGILGPRLSRVDTLEPILCATIVDRQMDKIVVAVSHSSIRIYAAPRLDLIQRIQRHKHDYGDDTTFRPSVSISKGPSGAMLEILSSLDVRLWTFFGQAPRAEQPKLLLHVPKVVPAHPSAGAVGSIAGWFSTKAVTTSSLDDVFAGPERPEAPHLPPIKTKEAFVASIVGEPASATAAASEYLSRNFGQDAQAPSASASGQRPGSATPHATAKTVQQTQATSWQMGWNLDLARRRGEAMEGLENSLQNLERSANDWVKESKAALVKSVAKDKLTKF